MTNRKYINPNGSWTQTIVALVVGAILTLGTTYYTIYEGNKQAVQAENERYIKVKDNIVSIVEEHIVNQKRVDLYSIQRIIDIRIKEENVKIPLSVSDIISQAEYNILNSRHLDIGKKEEYEKAISEIQKGFLADSTFDFSKYKEADLMKSIRLEINKANSQEAAKLLLVLVDKYEASLKEADNLRVKKEKNDFDFLFDKPSLLLMVIAVYGLLASTYLSFYRRRLRRRKEENEIRKIWYHEREKLENEISRIISILNTNENLDDVERIRFKENLIILQERLEYLRHKFRHNDLNARD